MMRQQVTIGPDPSSESLIRRIQGSHVDMHLLQVKIRVRHPRDARGSLGHPIRDYIAVEIRIQVAPR